VLVWFRRASHRPPGIHVGRRLRSSQNASYREWLTGVLPIFLQIERVPRDIFASTHDEGTTTMSLGTILLIVLVIALIGAVPAWPYSSGWGYGPSGGLGLVVVVLIILVLMGRI
jgi:hypothetical protein